MKTPFRLMEPEGPGCARNIILDADADCVRDGLPRWCTDVARAKIDAAIAKAEGVE